MLEATGAHPGRRARDHLRILAQVTSVPDRRVADVRVLCASGAVLVLEIIAGRLLAPYVGVSQETFTAVIGVVLAGIEGHDLRAVGALLKVPEGTVKSRLFLARQRLRALLTCSADDPKSR